MNRLNLKKAIDLMTRVRDQQLGFDMVHWQSADGHGADGEEVKAKKSVEEIHACGNSACFAGYLAVTPDWIGSGGTISISGSGVPTLLPNTRYNPNAWNIVGDEAVAAWLDLPRVYVTPIIKGETVYEMHNGVARDWSCFYEKWWNEVTAQDVLEKLIALQDLPDTFAFNHN